MRRKLVLATMLFATAFAVVGCQKDDKKEAINPVDFVKADVEGFDGRASLSFELDYDKIDKKCKEVKEKKSAIDAVMLRETLTSLQVSTDDTGDTHKNGDEIELKFEWNKDNEDDCIYEIASKKGKYKVANLEAAEEVNPFDGLVITYEGIAPNGSADMDTSNCDEFVRDNGYFSFESSTYGLSNGDNITVKYSYYESNFYEEKKVVSQDTMSYTVDGLGVYVTSLKADEMKEHTTNLETELKDKLAEYSKYDWSYSDVIDETGADYKFTTTVGLHEAYYGYSQEYMSENAYFAVFKVDVVATVTDKNYTNLKKNKKFKKTLYFVVESNEIYKGSEGAIVMEEDLDYWTGDTSYMNTSYTVADKKDIKKTIEDSSYYDDFTVVTVE